MAFYHLKALKPGKLKEENYHSKNNVYEPMQVEALKDVRIKMVGSGQEAAHVSEVYEKVQEAISQPPVKEYVPYTWVSLVTVKREHYRALANYYVAIALLDNR